LPIHYTTFTYGAVTVLEIKGHLGVTSTTRFGWNKCLFIPQKIGFMRTWSTKWEAISLHDSDGFVSLSHQTPKSIKGSDQQRYFQKNLNLQFYYITPICTKSHMDGFARNLTEV